MKRPLLASILWGCFWCSLIAALAAPIVFGWMSNPACCEFTPIPQGWAASLNALPVALVIGAALGVLWWLAFHAFRKSPHDH